MQDECVYNAPKNTWRTHTLSSTHLLSISHFLVFDVAHSPNRTQFSVPVKLTARHHDGVISLTTQLSRFYSRRCRICWHCLWPCLNGPPGCDLMVKCTYSCLFSGFYSASLPHVLPELWCIVWCDQNSHNDVISVSKQVGAVLSSWVGIFCSSKAGKQFHVTMAKAHLFQWAAAQPVSAPLHLALTIQNWLYCCFKHFY